MMIKIAWSGQRRVVSFNIVNNDGKLSFADVKLWRGGLVRRNAKSRNDKSKVLRVRRLENTMTADQWRLLFKQIAIQRFPKAGH